MIADGSGSLVACSLLLLALWMRPAAALALQNITLPLPTGTTNHNTPGLICTPTEWTDLAGFYLFNYVAHAATVLTRPGERSLDFGATVLGSLLSPALGLYRGIEAIFSGAVFSKDHLRKAAKSSTLCCVVRSSEWRPMDGDNIINAAFRRQEEKAEEENATTTVAQVPDDSVHLITYEPPWILTRFGLPQYVHRQVLHGTCTLPKGYCLVSVPSDVQFSDSAELTEIASTYNCVKALIALVQTGYASLTLYRSRGDQIEQYGFAAFGLTVAPYAVMSMVNLIGSLCREDYSCLYMVESSIMDEARSRGGVFRGTVARIEEETGNRISTSMDSGAQPVDDLQFSVGDGGESYSHFHTNELPKKTSSSLEKSPTFRSESSTLQERRYQIKDLPNKSNYTGTSGSALLLIPSCNPFKKISKASTEVENALPVPHTIQSVLLRKIDCFSKIRTWRINFPKHPSHPRNRLVKYLLTLTISLTPFLINGLMSHFHPGHAKYPSTWSTYTMQWLGFGVFNGLAWVLDYELKEANEKRLKYTSWKSRALFYFISASPSIGGVIVVGQMMWQYGDCTWVGG